jgi:hypothetical protein
MPQADVAGDEALRAPRRGRLKMLLVLLVCAAPVIASYFTFYVLRPEGRSNYATLIEPRAPIPADLPLSDLWTAARPGRVAQGAVAAVAVGRGALRQRTCEERHCSCSASCAR